MNPKISLVTASYNSASSLEETIQSVLSQNYENLEYIVVDGGSTDGTLDIIHKYKEHISHIISEPDHGIYDALNKGLAKASGDIIGFLHSDDHFASDHVLKDIGQAFANQNIDGLYSDLEYIRKNGSTSDVVRHWKSKKFTPDLLARGWMPPHPTLYLKKHVYDSAGIFNIKYKIAADYDMILRVFTSKDYKFHYLPQVTVRMRFGGASNRDLKRIFLKSSEDFKIAQKAGLPALRTLLQKNLSKLEQFLTTAKI